MLQRLHIRNILGRDSVRKQLAVEQTNLFVFAVFVLILFSKEEVNGCALDLNDGMRATKGNDGDRFRVRPDISELYTEFISSCGKGTHQTPFFQSSFVKTTAHIASSPS